MSTNQNYIHWHTAFQAAAELELRENIEELTFEPEHYLSKEPLRIDLLILHLKNHTTHLSNEIGKIMRKHNIIEYKGPGDQLSIDTLYKVLGYACLYKSFGDTVDAISAYDITVSLFREAYPRELFKKLKEDTQIHEITEEYPGIYYISGFLFPLQIVVLRRLDPVLHSIFRVLSKEAETATIQEFLKNTKGMTSKRDMNNINAILQVSYAANRTIYQKIRREKLAMCEALRDLFQDELEEQYEAGEANGLSKGKIEIIKNMYKNNFTIDQIALASGKSTNEIKRILGITE